MVMKLLHIQIIHPQKLDYLWVQLDQNVRKKDSPSLDRDSESVVPYYIPDSFDKGVFKRFI